MANPRANIFWRASWKKSGFVNTAVGFQMRRIAPSVLPAGDAASIHAEDDADAEDNDGDAEGSDIPETA